MGKDKKSRSRNPSENKQEPASRSASAATAVRVPLPASSPTSESVAGDPSDHEEEMQIEPNSNGGKSPQNLENPQNQYASQVGQDPELTDDGSLASAQIEPSLGELVEESANSGAGDIRSPTSTDQSTSPDAQKPFFNLADELEMVGSDGSDGDMRSETGDQGTSPTVAQTEGAPEAEEPQKPEDANAGQSERMQKEKSKRLAAEERVKKLKAELKGERQKFEEEAEKARKKHEQALQKANQAREVQKVKLEHEENTKLTLESEVARYQKAVAMLEAQIEEDPGQPTTSNDSGGDMSRQKKKAAMEKELLQAINKEINAGSETGPIGRLPMASKSQFRPGARFLLAECEYLLDKSTPVYTALRAMADYADGGRNYPGEEDWTRLENFDKQLTGIIKMMENNMNRPNKCLVVARGDWKLAMERMEIEKQ